MADLRVVDEEDHHQRDNELRAAHRQAFERIRAASGSPGYHEAVSDAVGNLIDACEEYCNKRSDD
ncbi:MAG TPA: hypothetical protein VFA00_00265 [Actinomycetota bacterium]|jgi:hypothetical protein|nr:hypothetical protein [Actinomycetota bacterium]